MGLTLKLLLLLLNRHLHYFSSSPFKLIKSTSLSWELFGLQIIHDTHQQRLIRVMIITPNYLSLWW